MYAADQGREVSFYELCNIKVKEISWLPRFKSPGFLPLCEESNHLLAALQLRNLWSYPR